MGIEFKPDNLDFNGMKEWKNNGVISNVKIFTVNLPIGMDIRPFQPFNLRKDKKYAILVDIKVNPNSITLKTQTKDAYEYILNNVIFKNGLKITFMKMDKEPTGSLFPNEK